MTAVNKYEDDGGLDFKAVIANLIQEFDTAFHGKVFRFLSTYSYGVRISGGDCVTYGPDFTRWHHLSDDVTSKTGKVYSHTCEALSLSFLVFLWRSSHMQAISKILQVLTAILNGAFHMS